MRRTASRTMECIHVYVMYLFLIDSIRIVQSRIFFFIREDQLLIYRLHYFILSRRTAGIGFKYCKLSIHENACNNRKPFNLQ